ncbi:MULTISPECIES: GvpL/GvpF family gas vesicle protein [unclassified Streptomyces]|uniref:GvpL/GvpF family gas vesicle protein n=1 Tax=unclassified Streptomyces TaxID=2593676 RepID=UPI002DD9A571|nr:GvpL/GvpF family gas vesicle protein [Streptomyces sp. NBC_01257]WRZ69735.1 GvpL/GvpF family gas vesicle protein [Streptomyces sp. NBC_01257]
MTECGTGTSEKNAIYVFAVCRAEEAPDVQGLTGVTRAEPVRSLRIGSLTAIVQTVRGADFTDEVWQKRLTDEAELERYARAHHEVVSAVAARFPTVPLPLATLYNGDERAARALASESTRFRTALTRIAHHAEWGIKVYAPVSRSAGDDTPEEQPAAAADRARPAPGAGRAYLERKRNLQSQREERQAASLRVADVVDADVSRIATESRRLRPHGNGAVGDGRVQVLNATYLVAGQRAAELDLLVAGLRERTGAHIEVSGPWVPYSFVGEV